MLDSDCSGAQISEKKIFLPRNVPDAHVQPDSEMKTHHAINFRVVEIQWEAEVNRFQLFSAGEMRFVPLGKAAES